MSDAPTPSACGIDSESNKRVLVEDSSSEDFTPQRKMLKRSQSDNTPLAMSSSSKRDHHNMMERQRRSEMDQAFVDLGVSVGAPEKGSRVTIVNGAAVRTRVAAAAALTFVNISDGLSKCIDAACEMEKVLADPNLSEEEKNRRVAVLTEAEMRRLAEECGNPMQPWDDVVDDLNSEEVAGFGPPPAPNPSLRRPLSEYKALALRQHQQNMKFKEKKRVRDLAIANGEIVVNSDRFEDEDDDDCYGEDPAYRNDRDDGSDREDGDDDKEHGNDDREDGDQGSYDDDDDDDDDGSDGRNDGEDRIHADVDEGSDDGDDVNVAHSDDYGYDMTGFHDESVHKHDEDDDEGENTFSGFPQRGDPAGQGVVTHSHAQYHRQQIKQESSYEEGDREDYEGDDEEDYVDSEGNDEQLERAEGDGSWEDIEEEEEEGVEQEGGEVCIDSESENDCDVDVEEESQDEEDDDGICSGESVIKAELEDDLAYDGVPYIDSALDPRAVEVKSEVTVKSEVSDGEDQ